MLSARGADPSPVGAPERVLATLAADDGPLLVLMDLDMPEHQWSSIGELREISPGVTIAGLSESKRRMAGFLRSGADATIEKPVDPVDLEALLVPFTPPRSLRSPKPDRELYISPLHQRLREVATRATLFGAPICILGETGVGKTILAQAIHGDSGRRSRPFVTVLCTAIPRHLFEAELFGFERGAFTGASATKPGRFELADGGTIFLDEIGDMHLELQAKLLQVLEGGGFCRLGSNRERHVDVQLICATSTDLTARVERGRFRRDLFERIYVIPLEITPLRQRRDEIGPLFHDFVEKYRKLFGRPVPKIGPRLEAFLRHHDFPGNVRELENIARRLVALQTDHSTISALLRNRWTGFLRTFKAMVTDAECAAGQEPLLDVAHRVASMAERELITQALFANGWNRRSAARALGVSYSTLLRKVRQLGIAGA